MNIQLVLEMIDVSDGIIATGFVYNSVGAIKNRALEQLGDKIGGVITDSFLTLISE